MTLDYKVASLASAGVFCGFLLAPSVANACSCFGETLVGQKTELAVNAELLLGDSCGGGDPPIVTVDGEPATLAGSGGATAYMRRIEPAVTEGQTVVLDFNNEFNGSSSLTLTVGPPDTTPPSLVEVEIELEEENDFEEFCGGGEPAAARVVSRVAAPAEDDDTRYTFSVYADGELVSERVAARFYNQEFVSINTSFEVAPAEVCVDVQAIDAAGNESAVSGDCIAGPGQDDDKGCGCAADDDGSGWLVLPLLGLLFGIRRRF